VKQDQSFLRQSPPSSGDGQAGTESPSSVARVSLPLQTAYERYERDKLAFIKHNPNASPSAYEAAMRAIAKRYGI
jgi:hypothetical protein